MGDLAAGPAGLELDVLELRVVMRSSSEGVRRAWSDLFEPFLAPAGSETPAMQLELEPADDGWELRVGGAVTAIRSDWPELQPTVITAINRRAVEQMPWLGVHAGVVATGSTAVAFPGESGRGKSTAVAACVAAGFVYVSDEALILDSEGRLVPYPRPISLSPDMAARLGMAGFGDAEEVSLPTAGMALLPADASSRLEHVVLLQRSSGAVARLVELPRADVVGHLLRNSFNHYRDPAAALRLTTDIARQSRCWELVYDGPEDVPTVVRDLLL